MINERIIDLTVSDNEEIFNSKKKIIHLEFHEKLPEGNFFYPLKYNFKVKFIQQIFRKLTKFKKTRVFLSNTTVTRNVSKSMKSLRKKI